MRLAYYDEHVIEKKTEVSGVGAASEVADIGIFAASDTVPHR